MPYFDETISRLSVHGKQFEEGATLHGFGLTGEEETMYDSPKYTSFHSGTDIGCVVACGESIIEAKTTELVEQGSNVATVMGVVMVGHHWQQERFLQLKWLNVNGEARSRVLVTIYRLKDMIVGSHRPVSLIRGGSSGES
ncbi:hypothetical protein AHAS_Ahas07G0147600 [Arachis hypogaea]